MHFSLTPFHIKGLDDNGTFTGYASVFNVLDYHKDRISAKAFDKSLHKKTPKMLFQHDPLQMIGKWNHISVDGYGLRVEGQLILDLPKAREVYTLLTHGLIEDLSIGYVMKQCSIDQKTKERTIHEAELVEISLVTFGANPEAKILTVKDKTPKFPNILERLEKIIQKLTIY